MPDREKLIRYLNYCASTTDTGNDCIGCERWEYDCGSGHCVDDLMVQAAEALAQMRWVPVTERMPDAGKVLCLTTKGHYKVMEWLETFKCWTDPGGIDFTNFKRRYVTHWMPLPEPPKGE